MHLKEKTLSSLYKNDDKDLLHNTYKKAWQTLHYEWRRIKNHLAGIIYLSIYSILLFPAFLSFVYSLIYFVFALQHFCVLFFSME